MNLSVPRSHLVSFLRDIEEIVRLDRVFWYHFLIYLFFVNGAPVDSEKAPVDEDDPLLSQSTAQSG